jgi:TolA-binding protein
MLLVCVWCVVCTVTDLVSVTAAKAGGGGGGGGSRGPEVQFSPEDFKLLDTFEAHRLGKADAVFNKNDFKQAHAEYDAFILEFPKSRAIAYALLRKARCLHLGDKRFEAIKAYQEVLDYFPNVVAYAAPALYHIGQCHWQNGDVDKAIKSWAAMAADQEYNKHYFGATAFNQLADQLVKQGKPDQAIQYYEQVATTFRNQNPEASYYAIARAMEHHIRTSPNEPNLRRFYVAVKTFDPKPMKIEGEVGESRDYWERVRMAVRRYGEFPQDQEALRKRYYKYWADVMEKKFPDWDDFQIDVADFRMAHEMSVEKWMERLDNQFAKHQKPDDFARIIKWIRLFKAQKDKVNDYYAKLNFAKMSNAVVIGLMKTLYDDVQNAEMGRSVFNKIKFGEMSDADKVSLARYFWKKDPGVVKDVCMMVGDKELGTVELLRFYASQADIKNGLPLADEVMKFPAYADEATLIKADLLYSAKEYEKAIPVYQMCNNAPDNLWRIADCYVKLRRIDQAIAQLREVENFFKNFAPEAALRIAGVYKQAGDREQHIAALRAVLKKYPKSGQSSSAHLELERMGVRIGGGIDVEK